MKIKRFVCLGRHIDIDFVNSEINYKKFPKEYQSPVKLINYLEETL